MTFSVFGQFEIMETPCADCRKPVRTFWHRDGGGMLSRPSVTLVSLWAFHTPCWDRFVSRGIKSANLPHGTETN